MYIGEEIADDLTRFAKRLGKGKLDDFGEPVNVDQAIELALQMAETAERFEKLTYAWDSFFSSDSGFDTVIDEHEDMSLITDKYLKIREKIAARKGGADE
jgi:hypothetical protein